MSKKAGFYEDEPPGGAGGKDEDNANKSNNNSKKPAGGKDSGKAVIGANGPNSSGWFGGIFNKFSLKPKNQMILPDDKNPAVSKKQGSIFPESPEVKTIGFCYELNIFLGFSRREVPKKMLL
jgi:hypothetical protein